MTSKVIEDQINSIIVNIFSKNDHCIVKGSYCQCHYCRCEKGQLHCKEDPKKKPGYGRISLVLSLHHYKSATEF